MSRVRRNIVANTLGRGWAMFMGIAILPFYVRFLGAEAYGLVGLYTTIAVVCSLFDAGISASLGRELARANARDEDGKQVAEFVRTCEVLYIGIGIVLGGLIAASSRLIVTRWLNLKDLNVDDAIVAVRLMGVFFAFQWSIGLYLAGLSGLQRQVEQNVITAIGTTLRTVGAVIVLWRVSPNIVTFYWWQVLSTAAYALASREALWRSPGIIRSAAAFRWSATSRGRSFAGSITLLAIVSVPASQLDKIVLSRLVSLEAFGYYSFATSVAGAVTLFGQPILAATYPAMIEAFARADNERLSTLFHRGAQLAAVAIFPPAAVLCAFSPAIVRIWARDSAMAANASDLVSACLVGPVLNAASVMPYNLTLASGRVRPAMMSAGIGALVYGSVLALLAPKLGVFAGALGSALVSLVGLLVMARFAVLPLLPGQTSSWLSRDVIVPLATAACVAGLFRVVTPSSASQYGQLACILLASLATMSCTILVTPGARQEAATRFQTLRALIHPSRG